MDSNCSDDEKENVATSCAKNLLGNVTKPSNSSNVNYRILQKLNQVLTEEGLNLNVEQFLQVTSTEKSKSESKCVIFSEEGEKSSLKKELDAPVSAFCGDVIESIVNSVFSEKGRKMDDRIEAVAANAPDVKSVDSSLAMEKKPLPEVCSSGEKEETCVAVKEERDEFLIMEEVDLDVEDVSPVSEIDAGKESPPKVEDDEKTNAAKENNRGDDNKDGTEVKAEKKAEETALKERASNNNDNVQTKYLWITNIESTTRAADLKKLFTKCGRVVGAKIVTDGWSGCYGYIAMSSKEDVDRCLKKFNNYELNGKKLGVSKSKPERLVSKKKTTETKQAHKKIAPPPPSLSSSSTNVRAVKEDTGAFKRKEATEETARERREMERLAAKKRKLDEEARVLREERLRQRKIEMKNREVQRKLDEERENLRLEKEEFEKEKCEIMSLERERQRRERENLEREKIDLERMKREIKKRKIENEKKPVVVSTGISSSKAAAPKRKSPEMRYGAATSIKRHQEEERKKQCYGFCSAGNRHSSVGEHASKTVRKSSDCERPRNVCERSSSSKLSKSLSYPDRGYSASKEDKAGPFASRGVKRCASPYGPSCEPSWKQHQSSGGGSALKTYQQPPKSNWGDEHTWKPVPAAPTPPRMGWNSLGRLNGVVSCGGGGGGGYGGGFSARMTSSSSAGIVCPSPPGVTYGGGKFDGPGYSHWKEGRKY